MSNFYMEKLKVFSGGHVIAPLLDRYGYFGLRIQCADGKPRSMFFLADDEGNGPGSVDVREDEPLMLSYLVVGLYEDDGQRWADSFLARDPVQAEEMAHKATHPNALVVAAVIEVATGKVVA
jgi:hypothetical protein